jgi:quercetin dioxygenase-like cupin family protein
MSFPWSDLPHDDPEWYQRRALHIRAGEGPGLWAAGDIYSLKATGTQTNGSLGLIEATIVPGAGPEPHAHTREAESFYLLTGELEFLDGDTTFTAGPGDFVHIPRGTRHRFKNVGIHAARMLIIFTPAGVEEVIAEFAKPAIPGQLGPDLGTDGDSDRSVQMIAQSRSVDLPDLR